MQYNSDFCVSNHTAMHHYSFITTNSLLLIIAGISLLPVSSCETGHKRVTRNSFSLDSLVVTGPPVKLCEQVLTSWEYIYSVDPNIERFGTDEYEYDVETTPVRDIFFLPEADIERTGFVKKIQSHYNKMAVWYHTWHAYELFSRKASNGELETRQDTINAIAHDRLIIPSSVLKEAFPDAGNRGPVQTFLNEYSRFDGKDDSPYWEAQKEYTISCGNIDSILPSASLLRDEFSEHFWEWYDKKTYVPEIDSIASFYLRTSKKIVSEESITHLKAAIEGEKEINRRTILALELIRLDSNSQDAVLYLGEILESGIYTKYILEAWIAWRAAVQLNFFSPSSFTLIPNRYYDKIRVKCMNTILRHIQSESDRYDPFLLMNLIGCEQLHRMYCLFGNQSLVTVCELGKKLFIQPSALGYDYLKEEDSED